MNNNRNSLMAKALGMAQGIEKMSPGERNTQPSEKFAFDYMLLREQVAKNFPDIAPLLPPQAGTFVNQSTNKRFSEVSFAEYLGWCMQIFQMLAAIENCD